MNSTSLESRLFHGYQPPTEVYDEFMDPSGSPRDHWKTLVSEFAELTPDHIGTRTNEADRALRENGVTFNAFQGERPWKLDLVPVVLEHSEWRFLERGIDQRARLLEALIRDVYGPQRLLQRGLIPPGILFANPLFRREFWRLQTREHPNLTLFAAEMARTPDGTWRVMADRSDPCVGLGYALENRIVTARLLSQIVHRVGVQRLAPFFIRLKNALHRLAGKENPRIVLLSNGTERPFYFEDMYLARYLGMILVEGGDLAVRDDWVYLKTLAGLQPVDVIFSRMEETGIDALEQGVSGNSGVPGLLQAVRRGHVLMANLPGCGLVESPIWMAFLPKLCQELLGEELAISSIPTWWCGDPKSFEQVQSRLSELVIKPAFQKSGRDEVIVHQLNSNELESLRARLQKSPHLYIAQELIARSATPIWKEGRVQAGHVALRCFAVTNESAGYDLMPGGLVRIAPTTAPMELSILAGESSKDLWILSDGPVPMVSLLDAEDEPVALRRTGALFPSRVADDLFWLGQSLERADFLSRLIRALTERMTSEADVDTTEFPVLVRAMADQGQIEPGFALAEFEESLPGLERILPALVVDRNEPRGLGAALSELMRLNSSVRDWISADTWRTTQQACDRFYSSKPRDASELIVTLERLIIDLAAVNGLIYDSMIRGPAWRFLDLGKRIERCRDTTQFLLSVISTGKCQDKPVLKAILEILDCRMTYRSRYMENVQQNGVLDLVITDETSPHSVSFQTLALAEHVDTLPNVAPSPLRTDEKRIVMSIVHGVRMITNNQLTESPPTTLEAILCSTDLRLRQLVDMLTRKFLVHSGPPRQITTEGSSTS